MDTSSGDNVDTTAQTMNTDANAEQIDAHGHVIPAQPPGPGRSRVRQFRRRQDAKFHGRLKLELPADDKRSKTQLAEEIRGFPGKHNMQPRDRELLRWAEQTLAERNARGKKKAKRKQAKNARRANR